ncbi:MAG TPA: dihydropteroate synthase [Chloroflexi bacterium]|nr:dihydropteroate synthase [Chloroflexota bacterium]
MGSFNTRILEFDGLEGLRAEMEKIGADPEGIKIMAPKGILRAIKLEGVGYAAANILKQEMLAQGAEAAIAGDIYLGKRERTDVLLLGTLRHYRRLIPKLRAQPLKSLQAIADEIEEALARYEGRTLGSMEIGGRLFEWGKRTYIMGILNVTPDSFSGDGLLAAGDFVGAALAQAERFVEEGADILDVGGESTRPGSAPIPAEEELKRVMPVVERLAREFDIPISIDTYKAEVARRALDAGAHMVNDVWGLRMDPELAGLVAERGVPVVVMHNRSRPKDAVQEERLGGRYVGVEYEDLMADIIRELRGSVQIALDAGVAWERIIVDPGLGFGKTVEQNLEIMDRLSELKVLGRPILVGPSRKSFIGYTLDLPPEERLEGTAATVALCIAHGADIVRVHDVREMVRVARMTDAIVRG